MTDKQPSRQQTSLAMMPESGKLLLFSDQQQDNFKKSQATITASSFIRLGMKEAVFKDCSFTQSNFEDSYFRKAVFKNVCFTGSSFRFCNFDKASFQTCDFRYCNFFHCKLPKDEIISCLPPEPNLRRDLARNLRANYEMIGDKKSADTFMDIEIQAYEDELKAIFFSKTDYYKNHYNLLNQILAGAKFLVSNLSGKFWGYGHRVGRLILSYIFTTCVLSLITYFGKIKFFVSSNSVPRQLTFWESINMGFCETVSASSPSFVPSTLGGQLITLSASLLGILFLALLAATLYRRIAR
jgi:uncharacterized protein YjbI with pentapeptide repeats